MFRFFLNFTARRPINNSSTHNFNISSLLGHSSATLQSKLFSNSPEKSLIEIKNGSKEYNNDVLKNISIMIKNRDRFVLLGQNGSGKSTLAKILWDDEKLTSGNIFFNSHIKIGYLPQTILMPNLHESFSIRDFLVKSPFVKIINGNNEEPESLSDHAFKYKESHFIQLLKEAGLYKAHLADHFHALSAGERTKVVLSSLFLESPDLLIMDEPTNNIDLSGIDWVRKILAKFNGAVFMITHDRSLILGDGFNKLTKNKSKIMELDPDNHQPIMLYESYFDYLNKKENEYNSSLIAKMNLEKKSGSIKNELNNQKSKTNIRHHNKKDNNKLAFNFRGERAEAHQSKKITGLKDSLEKINDQIHIFQTNRYVPQFSFQPIDSPITLISINDLQYNNANNIVFKGLQQDITKGQRIVITGENGAGKSTLLKIIMGILIQTKGTITFGNSVQIGYLDQEQESLDLSITAEAYIHKVNSYSIRRSEIYAILSQLGIPIADVKKPLVELSIGQRRLVQIAMLIISKANLLLLDEPTNHLSPQAAEAFENALLNFNGGILAVSHDRYFINKIATKKWEFEKHIDEPIPSLQISQFKP